MPRQCKSCSTAPSVGDLHFLFAYHWQKNLILWSRIYCVIRKIGCFDNFVWPLMVQFFFPKLAQLCVAISGQGCLHSTIEFLSSNWVYVGGIPKASSRTVDGSFQKYWYLIKQAHNPAVNESLALSKTCTLITVFYHRPSVQMYTSPIPLSLSLSFLVTSPFLIVHFFGLETAVQQPSDLTNRFTMPTRHLQWIEYKHPQPIEVDHQHRNEIGRNYISYTCQGNDTFIIYCIFGTFLSWQSHKTLKKHKNGREDKKSH